MRKVPYYYFVILCMVHSNTPANISRSSLKKSQKQVPPHLRPPPSPIALWGSPLEVRGGEVGVISVLLNDMIFPSPLGGLPSRPGGGEVGAFRFFLNPFPRVVVSVGRRIRKKQTKKKTRQRYQCSAPPAVPTIIQRWEEAILMPP
jgi:hypothetical protein